MLVYMVNKIKCFILGHKWKYNFPSLPNKSICIRCSKKAKLNLKTFEWEITKTFKDEKRTDKEIISNWVF